MGLGKLKFSFCGDIMLAAEVGEYIGENTVGNWLEGVSKAWIGSDLLIGNLESPCVTTAESIKADPLLGRPQEIIFRAPTTRLKELADAGFSAVTLANNHILNCGPLGLLETIRGLDEVGIHYAGAGMNLSQALEPAFIPVRGLTIGLVAFSYGPPAERSSPGAAPCEPRLMRRSLSSARARADIVIAALHQGVEYSDVPPSDTRALFRFLAENGADIVVGHHPHVLQGLEWYNNVPIAYSLGDFLFNNSLGHVAERNFSRMAMGVNEPGEIRRDPGKFERGAVLRVDVSDEGKSVSWFPFRQDSQLRPQLSKGEVLKQDLGRLEDLSLALLNEKDPRHAIANNIKEIIEQASLEGVSLQHVLKRAMRPQWKHFPVGLRWLRSQLRKSVAKT